MKPIYVFLIVIVLIGVPTLLAFYLNPPSDVKPVDIDYVNAVITLERTMCLGTCPAYKITIYGDGRVEYEGTQYVKVTGSQTAQITDEDVKFLVDEFLKIDYFSLEDEYRTVNGMMVTDMPSTITSITVDGRTKEILAYYGTPEELVSLANTMDSVTNSAVWVGP